MSLHSEAVQSMIDGAGGEPVTIGATTANGLVDVVDEEMLMTQGFGHMVGKSILLRVKTGTFAALAIGATVTVRNTAYKAHTIQQEGDGELTQVLCALN